ncbi:hypothetical protein [Clostridium sp. Marseille-Q2269]|uniref:hypothetical protein n=1 Tax=Clostridium sp. Marseille-Q2269 TaxID=2942205 RepID=UPI002074A4FE|nr:hypothetical protein [Clostridium sp. Marseille-Q2269]
MKSKKQKTVFFINVIIYILTLFTLNCTIRKNEVGSIMKLSGKVSDNVLIATILIGSLVTVFILVVILVLARFLLQLVFKLAYKGNKDKSFLNESYFVPLSIKIFLLIVLQIIMASGFIVKSVWISLLALTGYVIYIFVFKIKSDIEKNNKDMVFQIITGALLIFAL